MDNQTSDMDKNIEKGRFITVSTIYAVKSNLMHTFQTIFLLNLF